MNKIYNNLSVENLTKTKQFNQFDEYQKQEVKKGLKANLDVSFYANSDFNFLQMREIRLGLEKNLNVSIYAKSDFDFSQMKEIRLGLEDNLDVSIYAKKDLPNKKMEEIREESLKESTQLQCTLFVIKKIVF